MQTGTCVVAEDAGAFDLGELGRLFGDTGLSGTLGNGFTWIRHGGSFSERFGSAGIIEPVGWPLAGIDRVVGPVRLLLALTPVEHGDAVVEISDGSDEYRLDTRGVALRVGAY